MRLNNWLEQRPIQFWIFNIAGWTLWGAVGKYLLLATLLENDLAPGYGLYVALISLMGLVISLGMHRVYRWVMPRAMWTRILALPTVSAAAAYLWISLRSELFSRWFDQDPLMQEWESKLGEAAELYEKISFVDGFGSAWSVMVAWSVLYYAATATRLFAQMRERTLTATAMAHESQLKMLRYQLNPHFLFNTLNAISTLILEKENGTANSMVMGLSRFLRYSIDNDPMQRSTLGREIDVLTLYLDIERVRFEDRLHVDYDISEEAKSAWVPNMVLQPLVENALKYAIAPSEKGGRIRIIGYKDAAQLVIQVCDNGPGLQPSPKSDGRRGVGLRNTRDRLTALYGQAQQLELISPDDGGLCVEIRIPYESELAR